MFVVFGVGRMMVIGVGSIKGIFLYFSEGFFDLRDLGWIIFLFLF